MGVKVLDGTLNNDSVNWWDDDSVEILIDSNHSHGTTYDATDFQIAKPYNDAAIFITGGDTTGIIHQWANISGGYSVELAIPWTRLGVTPTEGTTIGLDIGVNDDDNGAGRNTQMLWSTPTPTGQTDTSAFGHAVLASPGPAVGSATITEGPNVASQDWHHQRNRCGSNHGRT